MGPDPAAIAAWLRRVDATAEVRGAWKTDPKTGRGTSTELTGQRDRPAFGSFNEPDQLFTRQRGEKFARLIEAEAQLFSAEFQ